MKGKSAKDFEKALLSVVDENYKHYSKYKGIPTCDIGDVYEWIEEAKKRLKQ